MRLSLRTLTAVLFLGLIATIAQAQHFSADVVYLDSNSLNAPAHGSTSAPRSSSRLYVSGDKIRLETNGVTGTILLVDGTEHTAVAMQPEKKAYQPLASGPSEYFRVDNVDDACPNWQSVAEQKIICEKAGPEVINGRETVKYRAFPTNSNLRGSCFSRFLTATIRHTRIRPVSKKVNFCPAGELLPISHTIRKPQG